MQEQTVDERRMSMIFYHTAIADHQKMHKQYTILKGLNKENNLKQMRETTTVF